MIATPTDQEHIIQLLINKLQQEGFQQIQAKVDGYETPQNIFLRDSGQTHTPSLTALQEGRTFFFDIDLREPIPLKLSKTKWGQMARWAAMKYGRYFLVVLPTQVAPVTQMCAELQLDIGVLSLTPEPKTEP